MNRKGEDNYVPTFKKSIMNEGRSARASTCCVSLLWWCTWSKSNTESVPVCRLYNVPTGALRPRLFSFSFFFRLKLVSFLFCFWYHRKKKQAFNALPIPDTPTAWSTNSINDSFLRTWPKTTKKKMIAFQIFRFQGITKALKSRRMEKKDRRIANFDTINYAEGGQQAGERNGRQPTKSWQKNQPTSW